MLRGQIMAVNGIAAADVSAIPDVAWVLRGDRGLTYGREAPEGGEIVEGTWWAPDYQGPPLVSFDAEIAAGLDIGIGDTVTVNVLGARSRRPSPICAKLIGRRVGSISSWFFRRSKWRAHRTPISLRLP